jgi:hypothetical protein
MPWLLVPCLVQLRSEFNAIAPDRSKASDGSVGDPAHAASSSDHNPDETGNVPIHDADKVNEVHAIDVDADLRTDNLTMEKVVQFLLGRLRSGAEKRLRYIIYNRRIWSATSSWVQKPYTGANPHDKHAHFSASYSTSREADTSSWHLEELVAALTKEELRAELRAELKAFFASGQQPNGGGITSQVGRDALNQGVPNGVRGGVKTPAWVALEDLGTAVVAVGERVGVAQSELAAKIGSVDDEVLAALADTGRSDEDLANALRAALGNRAAAVGALLAG